MFEGDVCRTVCKLSGVGYKDTGCKRYLEHHSRVCSRLYYSPFDAVCDAPVDAAHGVCSERCRGEIGAECTIMYGAMMEKEQQDRLQLTLISVSCKNLSK